MKKKLLISLCLLLSLTSRTYSMEESEVSKTELFKKFLAQADERSANIQQLILYMGMKYVQPHMSKKTETSEVKPEHELLKKNLHELTLKALTDTKNILSDLDFFTDVAIGLVREQKPEEFESNLEKAWLSFKSSCKDSFQSLKEKLKAYCEEQGQLKVDVDSATDQDPKATEDQKDVNLCEEPSQAATSSTSTQSQQKDPHGDQLQAIMDILKDNPAAVRFLLDNQGMMGMFVKKDK